MAVASSLVAPLVVVSSSLGVVVGSSCAYAVLLPCDDAAVPLVAAAVVAAFGAAPVVAAVVAIGVALVVAAAVVAFESVLVVGAIYLAPSAFVAAVQRVVLALPVVCVSSLVVACAFDLDDVAFLVDAFGPLAPNVVVCLALPFPIDDGALLPRVQLAPAFVVRLRARHVFASHRTWTRRYQGIC